MKFASFFNRIKPFSTPAGDFLMKADQTIRVKALWDDEAGVWSASSDDIIGLAIEAKTKEALVERLKVVIPELLELNHAEAAARGGYLVSVH
ncbi:MAG: hypothetical protein IBGAMO2_480018 [Arenicellales bacterium IbO2]|nr:MAG: hypothetical protein IBGAMO2_480018 [Arenicellales bacterium IbO2]